MNTCFSSDIHYSENKAGRFECHLAPALRQSSEIVVSRFLPRYGVSSPYRGRLLFPENPANNNSHYNARKDVKQELLHKASSFTEDCPASCVAHLSVHDNVRPVGFRAGGGR